MSPSTRNCIRLLGVTAIAALCVASPASARTVSLSWAEADFTSPTLITNTFWPLPEDATFIYMAETADGCEINVVDVLAPGDENGTKQITFDGTTVQARVVLDQAYEADDCDLPPDPEDLVEKTHDWFAQDDDGNIWYLGEDSRECEEGVCDAAPGEGSWEAGQEIGDTETIAEPGIIMLAEPQSGDRYRQEFAPDVALVNTRRPPETWLKLYRKDGAEPVRLDVDGLRETRVIQADLLEPEGKDVLSLYARGAAAGTRVGPHFIRHDPAKLGRILRSLIEARPPRTRRTGPPPTPA